MSFILSNKCQAPFFYVHSDSRISSYVWFIFMHYSYAIQHICEILRRGDLYFWVHEFLSFDSLVLGKLRMPRRPRSPYCDQPKSPLFSYLNSFLCSVCLTVLRSCVATWTVACHHSYSSSNCVASSTPILTYSRRSSTFPPSSACQTGRSCCLTRVTAAYSSATQSSSWSLYELLCMLPRTGLSSMVTS